MVRVLFDLFFLIADINYKNIGICVNRRVHGSYCHPSGKPSIQNVRIPLTQTRPDTVDATL